MTNKHTIRRATKEDAEQYIKLSNLVWRTAYKDIFNETVFNKRESKQIVSRSIEYFKKQIEDSNFFSYVVESQGQIIGLMTGVYLSNIEFYKQKKFAELQAIHINPTHQHNGIGRELFKIFKCEIENKNIFHFVIGVLEENYPARQIYEKWGGILDNFSCNFANKKEIFYTYTL